MANIYSYQRNRDRDREEILVITNRLLNAGQGFYNMP